MKITNEVLMNSIPALNELAGKDIEVETSFKLAEFIEEVNKRLKAVNSVREKILKDQIQKDENGQPIRPDGDVNRVVLTDKGAEDLTTLMNIEQEYQFEKMKLSQFAGIKVKPSVFLNLSWMIGK